MEEIVYIQLLHKYDNSRLYVAVSSIQWGDNTVPFEQMFDSWHNITLDLKDFEEKTGIVWDATGTDIGEGYDTKKYIPKLTMSRELYNSIKRAE